MSTATLKENKMGVMPVGKLLANMALPMIASMLVQALYNVVDSIYVSQISESAVYTVINTQLSDWVCKNCKIAVIVVINASYGVGCFVVNPTAVL